MSRLDNGETIAAEDIAAVIAWSRETFGPGMRTNGVVDHITKELEEIKDDPHDVEEWVDVIILGIDGAWRAMTKESHSLLSDEDKAQEIISSIHDKWFKNSVRTWPDWRVVGQDKAIEHDRTHD